MNGMTEERYTELLEAAPPILRNEMLRVLEYKPQPAELAVSVFVALQPPPRGQSC